MNFAYCEWLSVMEIYYFASLILIFKLHCYVEVELGLLDGNFGRLSG